MSAVERWRMPSGRIATIDLRQSQEAIDDARDLLRTYGGAVPLNEETPDLAVEGSEITSHTCKEHEMNTSTVEETSAVREAIEEWTWKYLEARVDLTTEVTADEEFQRWAAAEIEQGPWTMSDCVERAIRHRMKTQAPPFPYIARPSWAVDVEIGAETHGELFVQFRGREHESGSVSAQLLWSLYVVVGPNAIPGEEGFDQDAPIGTPIWEAGPPEVRVEGVDFGDVVTDAGLVEDAARVLSSLAEEMRALEASK